MLVSDSAAALPVHPVKDNESHAHDHEEEPKSWEASSLKTARQGEKEKVHIKT